MKTMKRFSSLLLALVLVLNLTVTTVHAETTDEVTIIGFEVDPVTLADTPNCTYQDENGNDVRAFNVLSTMTGNATATVFFSDGSGVSAEIPYFSDEYGINFDCGDLSATVGWTAGTYTHTVSIAGTDLTYDVEVTIVANSLQSVSLEPVSFVVGRYNETSSDGSVGIYQPFMKNPMATLYYGDGTTVQNGLLELQWEYQYDLDQSNSWTVGSYEIPLTVEGKETVLTVNIIEDPISSVTVSPVSVIKGRFDTTSSDGSVGIYNPAYHDPQVTIIYKDGSVITTALMNLSWFYGIDWRYQTDLDTSHDWDVGAHTVELIIDGHETTMTVNVTPDPIASVIVESGCVYEGVHQLPTYTWDEAAGENKLSYTYNPQAFTGKITINYTDGTSVSGSALDLRWDGYSVEIVTDDPTSWELGKRYPIEIRVEGHTVQAECEVKANPVESVTGKAMEMLYSRREFVNVKDPATDTWYDLQEGYQIQQNAQFTIKLKDGTVYNTSLNNLESAGVCAMLFDPQRPDAPLEPGKTYDIEFRIMGITGTLPVTINNDGIKSMTATARYDLYETLSGYTWNIDATDPMITVEKYNGEKLTFAYWNIDQYFPYESYSLEPEIPLDNDTWEPGTYNAVLTINGASCTFPVKVLPNPVESYTIQTKYPFVENVHGQWDRYWDGEGVEHNYFSYQYSALPYTILLHMTDGTTETHTPDSLYEKFRAYSTTPHMGYDEDEVTGPGTYTVYSTLMEMFVKQTITIVGSQVTDISGTYDGTLMEGMSGELYWDGYAYVPDLNQMQFKVTYSDGTVKNMTAFDTVMGSTLAQLLKLEIMETYQQTTSWQVGTNQLHLTLGEIDFAIDITLVANNIKTMTAKATKPLYIDWYIESVGGTKILNLTATQPETTFTYEDGTTETFTYEQLSQKYRNVHLNYLDMTWIDGPGTYTVTLWIDDIRIPFQVELLDNPVKSVTATASKPLTEGESYLISDTVPIYTVTLKDGTVKTYYGDDQIYEAYGFYPRWYEDAAHAYTVGTNSVEVQVLGYTIDYSFQINKAGNPLTGITAKAVAPLYENPDPYHGNYNYTSLVELTLTYADGSTKAVMANQLKDVYGQSQVMFYDLQDYATWYVGKHSATVYYGGFEAELTVEVVANPYTAMTISGTDSLTVTLKRADGTATVMNAYDFQVDTLTDTRSTGYLLTDGDTLYVEIVFGSTKADIISMTYQGLTASGITGCSWLSSKLAVETVGDVPEVSLDKNVEEMTEMVDENATRVWLTVSQVDENNLTDAESQMVQEALESLDDHEAGIVLDLNLFKQTDTEGTSKVSQIPEKLAITIGLPEELAAMGSLLQEVKIIRIHNGEVEILDTVYDAAAGTVTFHTDRFSIYSLSYNRHKLTKQEAKAADCTNDGNTEYYSCSHCDKIFADAEGKTETTLSAVTVKAGHKLEKVSAKEATETATGNTEHYKCSVCGKLFKDDQGKTETTEAAVTTPKKEPAPEETTPPTEETTPPTEETAPSTEATKPGTGSNPETGDRTNVMLLALLATVSVLLIMGALAFGRKRYF